MQWQLSAILWVKVGAWVETCSVLLTFIIHQMRWNCKSHTIVQHRYHMRKTCLNFMISDPHRHRQHEHKTYRTLSHLAALLVYWKHQCIAHQMRQCLFSLLFYQNINSNTQYVIMVFSENVILFFFQLDEWFNLYEWHSKQK